MKTKIIATTIAALGAIMTCIPISAAETAKESKDTEVKKENIFEKSKKAVVDAAHTVADKSVEIYGEAKDGTVKTAEKVGDKSAEIYENTKAGTFLNSESGGERSGEL